MAALFFYVASFFHKTQFRSNKYNLPLPRSCHVVLDESVVAGRYVFVIGDVHGCYDEMCDIIDLARTKHSNILFLFAGDMINKGPKNVEVIRKIREMGRDVYAVRGNHEECVLREVRSLRAGSSPQKRYQWIQDLNDNDVDFIQELPYTVSIPSMKVMIAHAGVLPNEPLGSQKLYNFTNMRNVVVNASGELEGVSKLDSGKSWTSYWTGPDHVYFGHDARRGLQLTEFATGLDTGCVYGGQLTGVFVNGSRERLQVKSRQPARYADD